MADLDLYLLRYFLAVVETGSFTAAADRVFVTQPSLSAGIKRLEGQVGHTLFERTNRRVFLTDAGARFLPRAKAVLHECNMAMLVLADTEAAPVLRIGFLITLSNRKVAKLLASFRDANPGVTIEVRDGTEQELTNRLEDRTLDYAITVWRGEGGDEAIKLFQEPYTFILAKDHALAKEAYVGADAFAEERMVVRSRCEILSETSRYFTDRNVRPRLVYRTANDGRAVAMVAAGLGGTVVPASLVDERVAAVRLNDFDHSRQLALRRPRYDLPKKAAEVAQDFERHVLGAWGEGGSQLG